MRTVALPVLIFATLTATPASADDPRQLVEMPPRMQEHMLGNMRDHLVALDEILAHVGEGRFDAAAEVAERRLGMSSLESHGASHMSQVMPQGMRETGTRMHRAASRLAVVAQEGDALQTYRSLKDVTGACVACHAGYRIR